MSKNPNSRLPPRPPALTFTVQALRLIRSARTAHLATADANGQPHVIPVCFVLDGKELFSPIDQNPKQTQRLQRLRNIAENSKVALVIDHYDEDWRNLAYVLIFGKACTVSRGVAHQRALRLLRRKYPQYRTMDLEHLPVIRITARRFRSWHASFNTK